MRLATTVLCAALLLIANAALAEEAPAWKVGPTFDQGRSTGCIAAGPDHSGAKLSVLVDPSFQWSLIVSNADWNLPINSQTAITAHVDQHFLSSGLATNIGRNVLSFRIDGSSKYAAVQMGAEIEVKTPNGELAIDLTGSAPALIAVLDCVRNENSRQAQTTPSSPVLPASSTQSAAAGADASGAGGSGAPSQDWSVNCSTALGGSVGGIHGKCFFHVSVNGNIDEQQLSLLTQSISYKHDVENALSTKLRLSVEIASEGGQVPAAMKIGRLIRNEGGMVAVNKDCFSACIFVLIGGIERQVQHGRIGIHRPYLDAPSNERSALPSDIKSEIGRMIADVGAYVDEMNVPRRVVDDMMSVPSDSIKLLTIDDLFHYGILPVDPFEREAREIAEARAIGISHAEYLARKRLARITCFPNRGDNPYLQGLFDDLLPCWENIMRAKP